MKQSNSIRLAKCLAKNKNKTILSPYITAGYPSKDSTVPLMHEMVKAGCDVIELGIPFSEPMAEGIVIQGAMEVALANNTSIFDVLKMVTQFREQDPNTPIILMGYMNPIEQIGFESFAKLACTAGVDGTLIVDLPPEEANEMFEIWSNNNLDPILLCSPTTSEQRMALIAKHASGYVYYVSLKGVTGSKSLDIEDVKKHYLARKSILADIAVFVGFGIKSSSDAASLAQFADGVVIGAALIEKISDPEYAIQACYNFLHPIKQTLKNT